MFEAWSPAIVEPHKNVPDPLDLGQQRNAVYKGFAQPFIAHMNMEPLPKFQAILCLEKRKKCYQLSQPAFLQNKLSLDLATFTEYLFLFYGRFFIS